MANPKALAVTKTPIPGLVVVELPLHGDNRGWFKENWQREKMAALGLPDFRPVQNNISFNVDVGVTRGLHAEPWDKYVSVASGRIFGAWVDLREGASFGSAFTTELDASRAVFVPRGVANGYQTLEPNTAYTYLVNDHWDPDANYSFLNLADASASIDWPIPLNQSEISEKDRAHPMLASVIPVKPRKTLVLGGDGQLGRALRQSIPAAEFTNRTEFDVTNPQDYESRRWGDYSTIINASAYTKVDDAETATQRGTAWAVNASSVGRLARIATKFGITLVHVSSDYVFDGTVQVHTEDEPFSPLGVYGQTKTAGDIVAATTPRHYIVRTSWVIGDGPNFVRTMVDLAERGVSSKVIDDQVGRLTFADDLAEGIRHLLATHAQYGTYNVTNDGATWSWADVAKRVYELCGKNPAEVHGVPSVLYFAGTIAAPRPPHSSLDLEKIKSTGFKPREVDAALRMYLDRPRPTAHSGLFHVP